MGAFYLEYEVSRFMEKRETTRDIPIPIIVRLFMMSSGIGNTFSQLPKYVPAIPKRPPSTTAVTHIGLFTPFLE